jgi:hypothetical protein
MVVVSIIIMNERHKFHLLITRNLPTLSILIPLHLPCTPSIDYAYLFTNYENTFSDYIDFSVDYAHNSDDCANTPNDQANTTTNSTDILHISSLNFYIPNPALL